MGTGLCFNVLTKLHHAAATVGPRVKHPQYQQQQAATQPEGYFPASAQGFFALLQASGNPPGAEQLREGHQRQHVIAAAAATGGKEHKQQGQAPDQPAGVWLYMPPVAHCDPQSNDPDRRPRQGVDRQVEQVGVNGPQVVERLKEPHHVLAQHQAQPALPVAGSAIQVRKGKRYEVHHQRDGQGRTQTPIHMLLPALLAQYMGQQDQPRQHKTDQPFE